MCKCSPIIAPLKPVCSKPKEGYALCAYCDSNRDIANPDRYHKNWFEPVINPDDGTCESIRFNGKITIREALELIGFKEDCDE